MPKTRLISPGSIPNHKLLKNLQLQNNYISNDGDDEGSHFATISHSVVSNDDDYSAIGRFNVEFPISDNEKPEVLILSTDNSTNVIERTTSNIVFEGRATGGSSETLSFSMPVTNVNTNYLRDISYFWNAADLDRYLDSWSKENNGNIKKNIDNDAKLENAILNKAKKIRLSQS